MKPADQPRTFSTWIFIAAFAALGAVGIFLFISGDRQGSTEIVPTQQSGASATTTPAGSADTDPAVAPAPGDETAASPGVDSGRVSGTNSFTFEPPAAFASIPPGDLRAEVPPATATAAGDRSINLTVECGYSIDEFVAQIVVNEGADVVTVAPTVIVPVGGNPCPTDAPAREFELPLDAPLGTRPIVVVPAGTALPGAGSLLPG